MADNRIYREFADSTAFKNFYINTRIYGTGTLSIQLITQRPFKKQIAIFKIPCWEVL